MYYMQVTDVSTHHLSDILCLEICKNQLAVIVYDDVKAADSWKESKTHEDIRKHQ